MAVSEAPSNAAKEEPAAVRNVRSDLGDEAATTFARARGLTSKHADDADAVDKLEPVTKMFTDLLAKVPEDKLRSAGYAELLLAYGQVLFVFAKKSIYQTAILGGDVEAAALKSALQDGLRSSSFGAPRKEKEGKGGASENGEANAVEGGPTPAKDDSAEPADDGKTSAKPDASEPVADEEAGGKPDAAAPAADGKTDNKADAAEAQVEGEKSAKIDDAEPKAGVEETAKVDAAEAKADGEEPAKVDAAEAKADGEEPAKVDAAEPSANGETTAKADVAEPSADDAVQKTADSEAKANGVESSDVGTTKDDKDAAVDEGEPKPKVSVNEEKQKAEAVKEADDKAGDGGEAVDEIQPAEGDGDEEQANEEDDITMLTWEQYEYARTIFESLGNAQRHRLPDIYEALGDFLLESDQSKGAAAEYAKAIEVLASLPSDGVQQRAISHLNYQRFIALRREEPQDALAALNKAVAAFEKVAADDKSSGVAETLEEMRGEVQAFRESLPADVQPKKDAADEPVTIVQPRRKVRKAAELEEGDAKEQPAAKKARTDTADATAEPKTSGE